jgi:hypothetical protein
MAIMALKLIYKKKMVEEEAARQCASRFFVKLQILGTKGLTR